MLIFLIHKWKRDNVKQIKEIPLLQSMIGQGGNNSKRENQNLIGNKVHVNIYLENVQSAAQS